MPPRRGHDKPLPAAKPVVGPWAWCCARPMHLLGLGVAPGPGRPGSLPSGRYTPHLQLDLALPGGPGVAGWRSPCPPPPKILEQGLGQERARVAYCVANVVARSVLSLFATFRLWSLTESVRDANFGSRHNHKLGVGEANLFSSARVGSCAHAYLVRHFRRRRSPWS